MILKHLFVQYNNDKGPTWGSRFMKFCGELVLGSPDKKGLGHLRKDLKETYYYIKEDRHMPMKALQAWQIQSILLAQYRDLEAPQVARATFLGLLPIIFVCVAVASPFNGSLQRSISDGSAGIGGSFVSGILGSEVDYSKMTVESCEALEGQIERKEITPASIPNFEGVVSQCRLLLN